ncbi:MAG: tRNA epoxyqueuosine(34) reductase QueG [Verrucomicrobiota bacterium]|nr:tRNA epoxyqueuosine(34) reductase QueG [Verrucomicrobiota bacterium]
MDTWLQATTAQKGPNALPDLSCAGDGGVAARERIRQQALALGFDECRFTTAEPPARADALRRWLEAGWHGEMHWLVRTAEKRADPQYVLPGGTTIIFVGTSYYTVDKRTPAVDPGVSTGQVARYARGKDYHAWMGQRLKELAGWVTSVGPPGTRCLWYVDTGPVLERELAERAGMGFVGKHTNLVSRSWGNWLLLGEILTTWPLPPDPPEHNRCGRCTRCLEACPTGAIVAPFQLDARRCISYLTIELRGPIPESLRPAIGNRIFGCDDCLAVCPWNRFAREGKIMRQYAQPDLQAPRLKELLQMNAAEFRSRFQNTPLARAKFSGFRRNVCVALGNVGDASCKALLAAVASDPDRMVAEHAQWALRRLEERGI